MIDGVVCDQVEKVSVFIIKSFSDCFKNKIRENLSSLCYGHVSNPILYSYENTIKEFMLRFDSKSYDTKKGMIGELLSHILLLEYHDEFTTINPFFNMEERSIKKAFDILLYNNIMNVIWYGEVKSGELGENRNTRSKNYSLLSTAKRDLRDKLGNNNRQVWDNAIAGAKVALDGTDLKREIVSILENITVDVLQNNSNTQDKNVLLSSVVFNELDDLICLNDVTSKRASYISENIFNNIFLISVQYDVLDNIFNFLNCEVPNE